MVLAAQRQIGRLPLAGRLGIRRAVGGESVRPELHETVYRRIHDGAMRAIVDPRMSLVFVHWGIPHPPAIYNAAQDDFSNSPGSSYVDNLKLLDRTIRDIRLTLERARMWDTSTILITSDHPFRIDTWDRILGRNSLTDAPQTSEVPFLLKMNGQKDALKYAPALQTVIAKDLVMSILNGEVSQAGHVEAWLNRNPPRQ